MTYSEDPDQTALKGALNIMHDIPRQKFLKEKKILAVFLEFCNNRLRLIKRGAVVEWLEQLGYGVESRRIA